MNVGQAAHLSGQMSGQAAQMNQVGSSGVAGADGLPQHQQMQDVVGVAGLDPHFVVLRTSMRQKIFECIGRKQSSVDWRQRLPELTRRLEEILFRKFSNKNDYYNMTKGPVEPHLQFAIKALSARNQQNQQSQQMSRQIASSSGYGTMIPTPGITQGSSGNSRMPYVTDNTGLSSSGAGVVPQNASMGTSLPGSVSNGYQHLTTSVPLNSTTSSVPSTMGPVGIQRQVTHMIPTPGFNNQQNVPANADYSNGAGYFNGESAVAPHMQQQQKQFPSNQNSHHHQIQNIRGHSNSEIHSNMLENSSAYGLSDGHVNGGTGLHGSNMQLTNRTAAPEAYMNISPYGNSPKPMQQQYNQHPPQRIPTSVDMAGSGSFYSTGSSALTAANNQSMGLANLQSRSRMNPMLLTNQLHMQSIQSQPQIKAEVLDQPEKVNFQSSQLTHEQLLHQQHSVQQHQVQPNSQFVQNQYHLSQQQPNSESEKWVSCIRILDPRSRDTTCLLELQDSEAAVSICTVNFHDKEHGTLLAVGTAKGLQFWPKRSLAAGFIHIYKFVDEGRSLELLHKTQVEEVPLALCQFQGRLLAGVGSVLRLYDLGKRKLLRKCENKLFPRTIVSIHTYRDRIYVGDMQESFHYCKYRRDENQLYIFADDSVPRWLTAANHIDFDTMAGADKFGNIYFARLPQDVSDEIEEDPTGGKIKWEQGKLNGAPNKVEEIVQFHVGDVVTCLQKASLIPGGGECLIYGTVMGSVGALLAFTSREDVDFFSHLEMHLRQEHPPLCGRDHMAYRSAYFPVKDVIDGDLCEQFPSLPADMQRKIADELDRTPGEILKKLEDIRNKII